MLLGEQPERMKKVSVRDHLLLIVIQHIDHAGNSLTSLIRPTRTVPLTTSFTFMIKELFEVVLVGRFLRTISEFAKEFCCIGQMFPGLMILRLVFGQIEIPGSKTREFTTANEIPVMNKLIVDFEPVDEMLHLRIPEIALN